MSPSLMTEGMSEDMGIRERLPLSLKEALEAVKCDSKLCDIMSSDLVERDLKIKMEEAISLESMIPQARTELGVRFF